VKPIALVLGSAATLALTVSLVLGGELQPAGAQSPEAPQTTSVQATVPATTPMGKEHALVRVAHMSGDRTPLSILVNGESLSTDLAVGQKTPYLRVGQRLVDVELHDKRKPSRYANSAKENTRPSFRGLPARNLQRS
jgi:hypothetical protein